MKELLRLSAVLSIICCSAALALSYTYTLTKNPIAYRRQMEKIKAINRVLPGHENAALQKVELPVPNPAGTGTASRRIYVMTDNATLLGAAFEIIAQGYSGPIHLMVGVLPDARVSGMAILQQSETPGLGSRIAGPAFSGQFADRQLAATNWKLKKDNGDFDQITGATISSRAVVAAVHDGLLLLHDHRETVFQKDHAVVKGTVWDF